MVQYLKFDSRKGTMAPFIFADSNVPPVCLLRVHVVILVDCPSADSDECFVYYNVPSPNNVIDYGQEWDTWPYAKVKFSAAQVDYEGANWLRGEIEKALQMTDGPSILTVTSTPPVTIENIATWA